MGNQARASNAWLWVCIALYVLLGAARFLHNSHLQRFTPFISVTILMGFAIVHGIRRYGWMHFLVFFIVMPGSGVTAAATSAYPWSTFSAGTSACSRSIWCSDCICGAQPIGRERKILAIAQHGYCPRSCMQPSCCRD